MARIEGKQSQLAEPPSDMGAAYPKAFLAAGTRAFSFTEPSLNLNGKCVMVTGGTGSFGKAFVRHVLRLFDIGRIIIYSRHAGLAAHNATWGKSGGNLRIEADTSNCRDELKQFDFHYELQREFSEEKLRCVRFCIGDVRNADRLKQVRNDGSVSWDRTRVQIRVAGYGGRRLCCARSGDQADSGGRV
jgi:hypothetical protein